jgi:hypothetical protein
VIQKQNTKVCTEKNSEKTVNVKIKGENHMICYFHIKGIIHYESVPPKQTLNQGIYLQLLENLCGFVDFAS